MAELSTKKVKKEKRRPDKQDLEKNGPSTGEVTSSKQGKGRNNKENLSLNGSNKKKKNKADESINEKGDKGPGSNMRTTKHRMIVSLVFLNTV